MVWAWKGSSGPEDVQRVYRHDDEVGRATVGARFARGKELRCKAPCVLRPGSMLDRAWYDGGGLVGDGDGRSWLRRWLKRGEERRVREREGKGRKKKKEETKEKRESEKYL